MWDLGRKAFTRFDFVTLGISRWSGPSDDGYMTDMGPLTMGRSFELVSADSYLARIRPHFCADESEQRDYFGR